MSPGRVCAALSLTLTLAALLPAALTDCPGLNWIQRGRYCYWSDPGLGYLRWSAAASLCYAVHPGAVLASVHSQAENDVVAQLAGLGWAWLGAVRFQTTDWHWGDWSRMDYTNWFSDYPHAENNCSAMFPGGSWESQDCLEDIAGVVCQVLAS